MSTPDIPYATPFQTIINSRGNEVSFALTAQDWNVYLAENPRTASMEEHVAVKYSTGDVLLQYYTLPPGARVMDLIFAWNLLTPPDIISKQLNFIARQTAQSWFAQDMFLDIAWFIPLTWPSSNAYLTGGGQLGSAEAFARGPFRYIRSFSTPIHSFNEYIPAMYVSTGYYVLP